MIVAARRLFLAAGYAATTMEAISEESDTPPATLYRLFESKLGILKALLDVAAGGDDEPVAFGDRPKVQALLNSDSPRQQVMGFAGLAGDVMARLAPIQRILLGAAGSDPQAAVLLDEHTRQRQEGQARIARTLARSGALRAGLSERGAADVIHALMSPEVFRLLTVDREWDVERYQTWLGETLVAQLLGAQKRRPPRTSGGVP
ncbi:MAG TPA: helix-turn-helix domain-containing protein [Acidimicrobiales bacterium]|nr:helix-turn-helix domain-containing protein [Acidimicrobiales bacterium]